MRFPQCALAALVFAALTLPASAQPSRPRARDLGLEPGVLEPGPHNAITDVAGVKVGHITIVSGDRVRTGVTAIVPHDGNLFQDKVAGAVFVGNAFGKLAGSTQVRELGTIETPIVLTNTLAVGTAVQAVVDWTLTRPGNEDVRSVNALVGETNDGRLNDIRSPSVTADHVRRAIDDAGSGPVLEGAVGAGTGTVAFGWKGGIGTSSRRAGAHTVGALVQSNYGGVLMLDGIPVGEELRARPTPRGATRLINDPRAGDGSCMIVVATDAPLTARDLERLAARAIYALARTGSSYSNGSGDYAIAFSTAPDARVRHGATQPQPRATLPTDALSGLFQAALEATEEAVYNSLLRAHTTSGNGSTVEALPIDAVRGLMRKYGRGGGEGK
ncbi:MAG TPA: P1 family peptidase [Vicinamibacterales bacterium]|nr:P1 family peptidase [Vicinamibacterales bacterium]